jgi:hypothetical protein
VLGKIVQMSLGGVQDMDEILDETIKDIRWTTKGELMISYGKPCGFVSLGPRGQHPMGMWELVPKKDISFVEKKLVAQVEEAKCDVGNSKSNLEKESALLLRFKMQYGII